MSVLLSHIIRHWLSAPCSLFFLPLVTLQSYLHFCFHPSSSGPALMIIHTPFTVTECEFWKATNTPLAHTYIIICHWFSVTVDVPAAQSFAVFLSAWTSFSRDVHILFYFRGCLWSAPPIHRRSSTIIYWYVEDYFNSIGLIYSNLTASQLYKFPIT